jgi:hypothetical protein
MKLVRKLRRMSTRKRASMRMFASSHPPCQAVASYETVSSGGEAKEAMKATCSGTATTV